MTTNRRGDLDKAFERRLDVGDRLRAAGRLGARIGAGRRGKRIVRFGSVGGRSVAERDLGSVGLGGTNCAGAYTRTASVGAFLSQ